MLNRKCCCAGLKLILTDIEMPELTGFELSQLVRQECRKTHRKELAIVAQTSLEKSAIQAQAAFSGIDFVLTKPLTPLSCCPLLTKYF